MIHEDSFKLALICKHVCQQRLKLTIPTIEHTSELFRLRDELQRKQRENQDLRTALMQPREENKEDAPEILPSSGGIDIQSLIDLAMDVSHGNKS